MQTPTDKKAAAEAAQQQHEKALAQNVAAGLARQQAEAWRAEEPFRMHR